MPPDVGGLLDIIRALGGQARAPGRPPKRRLEDLMAEVSKIPELREALANVGGGG